MSEENLWKNFMKTLSIHVKRYDLPWDKDFNLDIEKFAKDYNYFKKIHDKIIKAVDEREKDTLFTLAYMKELLDTEEDNS